MKTPSVIYHIFPDRFHRSIKKFSDLCDWNTKPTYENYFGGDLSGIGEKVGYLIDLGIETVYLNPIFEATSNHRYDTKNYYKIDRLLGNIHDFKRLLDTFHSNSVNLILDGVFNHCGTSFFAFQDLLKKNINSFYKNWFIVKKFPVKIAKEFYQSWNDHEKLVEYNFKNKLLRRYLLDVAIFWTKKGIDGWRLDAPERIPISFWRTFLKEIKSFNPDMKIIGEIWTRADKYFNVFDGVTNYLFRENVIDFVRGTITAEKFVKNFKNYYDSYPSNFLFNSWNILSSHDTPRIYSVLGGNIEKIKLAITLQFVLPGSPVIYYGDEIGISGDNDPDCRRTFNWNRENWNKDIFYHYKDMINIWKRNPVLRYGDFEEIYSDSSTLLFVRSYKKNKILCIFAMKSKTKIKIKLPTFSTIFSTNFFSYKDNLLTLSYGSYVLLLRDNLIL
jgi:glycosidase